MVVKLPNTEGDADVLPSVGSVDRHMWLLHQQTL